MLNNLKGSNTINKLGNIHTKGTKSIKQADLSGCLKGRHNLYNHLGYMLEKAEKNIMISITQNELEDFEIGRASCRERV